MTYPGMLLIYGDDRPCRLITVRTDHDPKPVPTARFDWSALDDDRYDGAPDSGTRNQIGYGASEWDAIQDLFEVLRESDDE